MGFFGRKKEEASKEWEDIQQIKEAIEPSDVTVSKMEPPSAIDQWTKETAALSENPNEWANQQFSMPSPLPKVEALQTPNISKATTWTATTQAPATKKSGGEIPDVPLFVKLDRYKNILHTISDLKQTVTKVKNAFAMFSEMERVKAENLRVLEAAVQKVEARIVDLDSEFVRPTGLVEPENEEQQWTEESGGDEGLHGMITDLRSQIDKLKEELDQMSSDEMNAEVKTEQKQ